MDRVRRMIGCEHRAVKSYTGKGIYTAILDSGVATHPDLRGRIVALRILCQINVLPMMITGMEPMCLEF